MDVISLVALAIGVISLGFSFYVSITRPKLLPKPDIEFFYTVRPGMWDNPHQVKGFDGWILPRNVGTFDAHDFCVSISVPIGEKILNIKPNYFSVDKKTDEEIVLKTDVLRLGFIPPPIEFFSTVKPEVNYWYHEQKGTIPIPH